MNALHFSYSFKLWTNACNCELPTLWLPVPRLHQPGLSNGITVSLHGSLPATDEKLIPLHVRLLSLFHPCEGCDCCHGVRLEISILWPKFCHPEHTQEKKKSENSHYSVKKKKKEKKKIRATMIQTSIKLRSGNVVWSWVAKLVQGVCCCCHRPLLRTQWFLSIYYKTHNGWGKYGVSLEVLKK